ncbi:MAG: sulfatase-like hydrolase/transferase [Nocardioides sp.]
MRSLARSALLCLVVLLLAAAPRTVGAGDPSARIVTPDSSDRQPDIILIVMDDFSMELLETMPQAEQMAAEGATFANSFVVDSLCCPSRTSLLTGQTPHQTGVLTNTPNDTDDPIGGYAAFVANGNDQRQFSLSLQGGGYHTGFIGKFMNGYDAATVAGVTQPPPVVPGWSDWQAILAGGYNGWGFKSTYVDDAGVLRLRNHPRPSRSASDEERDSHYSTNVTADLAVTFLEEQADAEAPYFLEIATYGPHASLREVYRGEPGFPSAVGDRASDGDPTGGNCGPDGCSALTLGDLPGYGDPRGDNAPTYLRRGLPSAAPAWRTNPVSLNDTEALVRLRDRARMVASIDRMVARVREAAGPDAYVFLTADNGFHLGQHQLNGGKGTPYDSDTRVPMVVVGPEVEPGRRDQFVSNIDLASTFEDLAGLPTPTYRDGSSFADSLTDPASDGARYAFFEHTYAKSQPGEVDTDEGSGGTIDLIPSYVAVRGDSGLLVRLDLDPSWRGVDEAWELYRYDRGFEDRNVFAREHDQPWARDLMRRLRLFDGCRPKICRAAAS